MGETAAAAALEGRVLAPVMTINAHGRSPFVLVCDHASNRIPEAYGTLGLTLTERLDHIAWDPGALAVARVMADILDAPLVQSTFSRLVIDPNRFHDAPDLITTLSELTPIPGNVGIDAADRARRISAYHAPFHAAIETLLDRRANENRTNILVTVHSFTPIYRGVARPWPVGLIHGKDEAFTRAFADTLAADLPGLDVGWNQPYAALSGVTYTLEHHGDERGLASTMIEIRNDEIYEPNGVHAWARRLARCLPIARGVALADTGTDED